MHIQGTRRSRLLAAIVTAVVTIGLVAVPGTAYAAKQGSDITKVRWTSSSVDATLGLKSAKLRVNVKDSTPVAAVVATLESTEYGYRSVVLSLEDGSNRSGVWMSEVWFSTSDGGTWRVTQVSTQNQDGYVYSLKKAKGIGGKLKVTTGVATTLKVTAPKTAIAGAKKSFSATLKRKGKAYANRKVAFSFSWYDAKGTFRLKRATAKTNKKGVATVRLTMPQATSVSTSATFAGVKRSARPSYSTEKTTKRTWNKAKLTLTASKGSVKPGTNVTMTATLTKGKTKLNKATVKFTIYDLAKRQTGYRYVKTNKAGKASISIKVTSADVRVDASYETKTTKAPSVGRSVTTIMTPALSVYTSTVEAGYWESTVETAVSLFAPPSQYSRLKFETWAAGSTDVETSYYWPSTTLTRIPVTLTIDDDTYNWRYGSTMYVRVSYEYTPDGYTYYSRGTSATSTFSIPGYSSY